MIRAEPLSPVRYPAKPPRKAGPYRLTATDGALLLLNCTMAAPDKPVSPSGDERDPFNTRRPEIHELRGWRRAALIPATAGMRLYYRSLRLHPDSATREILRNSQPPRLIVVWHNRSLVAPEVFRRLLEPERIACLISPSRMAAWEADFFRSLRLRVVRGSTTRRSIPALREMMRELRAGHDVGISPDGPSGPLYSVQPGAIALARKMQVPLLLIAMNARRARRLRTWDRHLVPWPFAKVEVAMREIGTTDPLFSMPEEAARGRLRRVYLEMTKDPFQIPGNE